MIAKIIELSVFLVFVNAQNEYCKLSCEKVKHTVCEREQQECGPGPLCGPEFEVIQLTDKDRQRILNLHNTLRNKVAAGNEPPQPPAANMKALSYNKELEFIAQCWASTCHGNPLKHDVCRKTSQYSYVGQSLGWWSTTDANADLVNATKNLIMGWYNEFKVFDTSLTSSFQSGKKMVEHFTQLVWANTTEVGCAISSYTDMEDGRKWYNKLLACNYGPGGNYLGMPLYIIGELASECSGAKPNKKYKALCGRDKPLTKTAKYNNDLFEVSI